MQELLEHPGEAQHVPGTPWKCVLKFVLHLMPAFMELVLKVALNGVLLRNKIILRNKDQSVTDVDQAHKSQCARTDLNKRFLPKQMTTTG